MNKQCFFKIVLTGPESSGKTTLAQALAEVLQTVWTPEFARFYVAALNRPYQYEDLAIIARGQFAWENWYAQRAEKFLICDTDWTVINVWEQFGFPERFSADKTAQLQHLFKVSDPHIKTYYFLCAPDFAWAPDPLREHPHAREALFNLYQNLLDRIQADYCILQGPLSQRLEKTLQIIQSLS
ncbi:MAG: ATP-binding protein [Bacteroidota bacterium]